MTVDNLRLHLTVLRCQAGDEAAFALLFEWFGARTHGYLRGLVGEEAAEDVQQEVWLSVFRGIRGLSNPQGFRTWLFQTTRHRAIDFLRRVRRHRELLDSATTELADRSDEGDEPLTDMDSSVVEQALTALPAPQREVLLLRYRDDLSYAEIALVVGCSIGTVRSRLHHAKRRLQGILKQQS